MICYLLCYLYVIFLLNYIIFLEYLFFLWHDGISLQTIFFGLTGSTSDWRLNK